MVSVRTYEARFVAASELGQLTRLDYAHPRYRRCVDKYGQSGRYALLVSLFAEAKYCILSS
jgi:hypothetical protein